MSFILFWIGNVYLFILLFSNNSGLPGLNSGLLSPKKAKSCPKNLRDTLRDSLYELLNISQIDLITI